MSLASLNISLLQSLKDYVEDQVEHGGFSTPSECLRTLVWEDQRRKAEEKLEALLLEGIQSGDPIEISPDFWENKRRQLMARHAKNKT